MMKNTWDKYNKFQNEITMKTNSYSDHTFRIANWKFEKSTFPDVFQACSMNSSS